MSQLKLGSNKMLLGVCSGIADYFKTDATLVRIITVVLAFFGCIGLIGYLVIWLVIYLSNK